MTFKVNPQGMIVEEMEIIDNEIRHLKEDHARIKLKFKEYITAAKIYAKLMKAIEIEIKKLENGGK